LCHSLAELALDRNRLDDAKILLEQAEAHYRNTHPMHWWGEIQVGLGGCRLMRATGSQEWSKLARTVHYEALAAGYSRDAAFASELMNGQLRPRISYLSWSRKAQATRVWVLLSKSCSAQAALKRFWACSSSGMGSGISTPTNFRSGILTICQHKLIRLTRPLRSRGRRQYLRKRKANRYSMTVTVESPLKPRRGG